MDYSQYEEFLFGTKPIFHSNQPRYGQRKFHIVVNRNQTKYALLNYNLQIIDSIEINPIAYFFTRKFRLKSFEKKLKSQLRDYKRSCRRRMKKPDAQITKMFKDILFYLDLCPDANPIILELLQRNISRLNPRYVNSQTVVAEYLRELSKLSDGNPHILPFDINFASPNHCVASNHKYISNSFISRTKNFVLDFVQAVSSSKSEKSKLLKSHSYHKRGSVKQSRYKAEKSKTILSNSQGFPYRYETTYYSTPNVGHLSSSTQQTHPSYNIGEDYVL